MQYYTWLCLTVDVVLYIWNAYVLHDLHVRLLYWVGQAILIVLNIRNQKLLTYETNKYIQVNEYWAL